MTIYKQSFCYLETCLTQYQLNIWGGEQSIHSIPQDLKSKSPYYKRGKNIKGPSMCESPYIIILTIDCSILDTELGEQHVKLVQNFCNKIEQDGHPSLLANGKTSDQDIPLIIILLPWPPIG